MRLLKEVKQKWEMPLYGRQRLGKALLDI